MTDLDRLRAELRIAERELDAARTSRTDARDALRRLDADIARLEREAGGDTPAIDALRRQRPGVEQRARDEALRVSEQRTATRDIAAGFATLPDPSELIGTWNGNVPILLVPFRLETRFMPRADGAVELWVRVYPDEISVAAFEERLSNAELTAARAFWDAEWHAGADESLQLGAWRSLLATMGPGRAEYVVSVYRPNNPAARPAVTIPAGDPLPVAPAFDAYESRLDSWNAPPEMLALPERWTFIGYTGSTVAFEVVGAPIRPGIVAGPDPSATGADGFQRVGGRIQVASDMRWMVDFDEAVAAGMGARIELPPIIARRGFDRLVLVGLRLRDDATEAPDTLASLIRAHRFSADGFALVPQGAPTNNTGEAAPYPLLPAPEESFRAALGQPFYQTRFLWTEQSDGQHLARALGLPPNALSRVHGAGAFDQRDARAMNVALWPATLGYFLDEMLEPRVSDEDVRNVRDFFVRNVRGRGPLPAVRAGAQPYGILPATAFSRWQLPDVVDPDRPGRGRTGFARDLFDLLRRLLDEWQQLAVRVSRVGVGSDPGRTLLDVLGLHPASAEFHQRYAAGADMVWNYLQFSGFDAEAVRLDEFLRQNAARVLQYLGFGAEPPAELFGKIFFTTATPIDVPLIDGRLLSETLALEPAAGDGRNYLQWLATSTLDEIRRESFGIGARAPVALLYRMLRHAALLSFDEAAVNLYVSNGLLASRPKEGEILNAGDTPSEGRWDRLYSPESAITGSPNVLVGEYLATLATVPLRPETSPATEFAIAAQAMAGATTAQLERAFADHIDACSYRLDAWLTALITERLDARRAPGIYLGGYGWLENVRPRVTRTVPVPPATVPLGFRDAPLVRDPQNAGHVFSPSINHAVTAAVLRNAYITHADRSTPGPMSVNLSSTRARAALALVEGIRNGQTLGALLGYQFERGLHDRHGLAEVDQFIYPLRLQFPISAGQLTPLPSGVTIDLVEARDVIDGLKLLEHVRDSGSSAYPYGLSGLPVATAAQAAAINAEAGRLTDAVDALADLCLTESVFQVTKGNYDRAGAMLKAVSEGNNPPEPEVLETPRSGINVTERLLLHLEAGLDPALAATNPYDGVIAMTPRARLEPGINRWLAAMLPSLDRIAIGVFTREVAPVTAFLTPADVGLQPIDLVWLGDAHLDEHSALGRLLATTFRRTNAIADDIEVSFDEQRRDATWGPNDFSLFEVRPLISALKRIMAGSRALAADDYTLPSDQPAGDAKRWDLAAWRTRIEASSAALLGARDLLAARRIPLAAAGAPFAAAPFSQVRSAITPLFAFGIDDAVPVSSSGASAELRDLLLEQTDRLIGEADRRRTAASAILAGLAAAPNAKDALDGVVTALFGGTCRSLPEFTFRNASELAACHTDRVTLRRHATSPTVPRDWLHGVGHVRPRAASLEIAFTFAELFGRASLDIATWQLPWRAGDYWIAVEYPAGHEPSRENLLLCSHHASPFQPAASQVGLLVDDWTEVIPNAQETAAIAVHFDRPNSEPPQALLLAVSPRLQGEWSWDDLLATLHETLDLARVRAVEPAQIDDSEMAQLLPATVSPVAPQPVTMSLDYRATFDAVPSDPMRR